MTLEEMAKCLEVWDQTIGCSLCGEAWWGDNFTDEVEDFHAIGCLLKGRKDVHEAATFES